MAISFDDNKAVYNIEGLGVVEMELKSDAEQDDQQVVYRYYDDPVTFTAATEGCEFMTYYQNEHGELCYAAGTDEPVTDIHLKAFTDHLGIDGEEAINLHQALKQTADSLTELANEMWPLYLEYKRQRSRRVWRKYG